MRIPLFATGLIGFLLLVPNPLTAQPSGNSSANWVTAGPVYAIARSGSTVYLGGNFNAIAPRSQQTGAFVYYRGVPAKRACAPPPIAGDVNAIVPDGMGGFFVGGRFERVETVDRQNLVHITSSCAVDTAWSGIVRGQVNALALANGVLYVGGLFAEAGQEGGGVIARSNLAAFSASTGVLQAWNPGADGEVHALKAYTYWTGIANVNVFVGGSFTQLAGAARQNIGGVLPDGTAMTFTADANAPVYALDVEPPSFLTTSAPTRLYAGGDFTTIAGTARNRIAGIVLATATVEPTFDPGANGRVRALAMTGSTLSSATFYVGGDFTQVGGGAKNYVAALSPAGLALPFAPEPNGPVYAIAPSYPLNSPSVIYIGGHFARAGGATRLNAAGVNPSTGAATSWHPAFNGIVRAVAATDYPGIAAGGEFDAIAAQRRDNIAAIDLDTGELLAFNPEINGAVNALAVRNEVLYAGGAFTRVGTDTRNRLASFAAPTRALTSWDPNADGPVHALLTIGGAIYAGGDFASIGFMLRGRLAAIDPFTGVVTTWTPPDFNASVKALAVLNTFLYVGGLFTTPAAYLTRIETGTGSQDTTWAPAPDGEVRALCTRSDTVYAGGAFTSAGGAPRAYLAGLDTTTGAATTWNPNPNGMVNALSCSQQFVYAGGAFTTVGTNVVQSTPRLAELNPLASGLSGEYATSFRPRALGIVQATLAASDGVLAGATGTTPASEEEPLTRVAFFANDFAGAPGPPTNPSVLSLAPFPGPGSVRLRWNAPVRGPRPTSYRLYAGSSPGASNYVNGLPVSGTEFNVLAPYGITAYVRVHAANAVGSSGPSEELAFVVNNNCTGPPDPPQGLSVAINGLDVTFNWTPSSGDAASSYRFEAGVASGQSDFIASLPGNATTFSAAAPEGVFYARLRGVGQCGTSLPSSELMLATGAATLPPTPPLNLNAVVQAGNTVTVSWSGPAVGTVTGYRLEAGSGFRAADLVSVTTVSTALSSSNVPPGTYFLRVYAIGAWGTSSASDELILVVP